MINCTAGHKCTGRGVHAILKHTKVLGHLSETFLFRTKPNSSSGSTESQIDAPFSLVFAIVLLAYSINFSLIFFYFWSNADSFCFTILGLVSLKRVFPGSTSPWFIIIATRCDIIASAYKSSISCLWLEFSKFRQSFNFAIPIFHLSLPYFSRKVSLPSEAPRWRFHSVIILIPVPLNTFLVRSSSASDFDIMQDFFRWHSYHLFVFIKLTHPTRS